MLQLLDSLPADIRDVLLGPRFERPRGPLLLDKYFWGKLVGERETLAAEGYQHPRLDWSETVSTITQNTDGSWSFGFDEKMTVRCGEGLVMRGERHEVWDASLAMTCSKNPPSVQVPPTTE
ncbi:MAG: hypothetical protein IMZ54_05470 [Acidobacteria bacterium]|nr:hypothetical protein [Acidobacteriota bacterium]